MTFWRLPEEDRPRRQQTKYHRGQRRQSQREEEDGKAKAHLLGARDRARCEQTLCAIGEKKPEGAADERQHEAFGNELAHEPSAPGAERSLDPELVSARLAFRELQIRDVGAGDEEHRNHGTKENEVLEWIESHLERDYAWPGNVRELEQCVRNIVIRNAYRPAAIGGETNSVVDLDRAELSAEELLSQYCAVVYARTGSYVDTARKLGLD